MKVKLLRIGVSVPLGSIPFEDWTEREFLIVDGQNRQTVGEMMERVCAFWQQFIVKYDLMG